MTEEQQKQEEKREEKYLFRKKLYATTITALPLIFVIGLMFSFATEKKEKNTYKIVAVLAISIYAVFLIRMWRSKPQKIK